MCLSISDDVSDKTNTISYVIINPSYDLNLEINDVMWVVFSVIVTSCCLAILAICQKYTVQSQKAVTAYFENKKRYISGC